MIRLISIIGLLVVLCGIVALYHVRYSAQQAGRRLHAAQRVLAEEKLRNATLLAEWSSLNDPRRLHYMSEKLLGLAPLNSGQFHFSLRPVREEVR